MQLFCANFSWFVCKKPEVKYNNASFSFLGLDEMNRATGVKMPSDVTLRNMFSLSSLLHLLNQFPF